MSDEVGDGTRLPSPQMSPQTDLWDGCLSCARPSGGGRAGKETEREEGVW